MPSLVIHSMQYIPCWFMIHFFIKDVPIYMFSTGNWSIVMTSTLYRPRKISTFVITKKSKFKNSGKNDDELNGKYQLFRPELPFYATQLG